MIKKVLALILALTLLIAAVGCTTTPPIAAENPEVTKAPAAPEAPAAPAEQDDEIKVAVILKSLTNPFWMMAKKAAEDKGAELGVTVQVFSTTDETDFNTQASQVEDAVTSGFDVICLVPSDGKALVPAVEEAVAKGVPVICLDSSIMTDKISSFVASDNVAGGAMAADYIGEQLSGKGNVAVIRGGKGHPVELERYDGFTKQLAAKFPDIQIVTEAHADWEAAKASNVMEDFLNAHPEINAVFCESDMMVIGASQMAIGAKRTDIIFVGLDGIVDALRAVKDGKVSADVAQSPDKIGSYGVEAAVKLAKGEAIDARIVTPMVLATKDNVDPLIKAWEELGF